MHSHVATDILPPDSGVLILPIQNVCSLEISLNGLLGYMLHDCCGSHVLIPGSAINIVPRLANHLLFIEPVDLSIFS